MPTAAPACLAERASPTSQQNDAETALSVVSQAYRLHRDLVYRLALRYGGGNIAWAEDVTHDVFVSLLKSIDRLDHATGLEGWLYTVTTNRCLNRIKVERFRNSAPIRWILGILSTNEERPAERVEMREDLRRALDEIQKLPAKQRVAFCMYHFDGLNMVQIAERIGHSKGYISKLIARAEAALTVPTFRGENDG